MTPKIKILIFKNKFSKIEKFKISKNGKRIIKLCANNRYTKFRGGIFIFGCAMAQKNQVQIMASLIGNSILGFLSVVPQDK